MHQLSTFFLISMTLLAYAENEKFSGFILFLKVFLANIVVNVYLNKKTQKVELKHSFSNTVRSFELF